MKPKTIKIISNSAPDKIAHFEDKRSFSNFLFNLLTSLDAYMLDYELKREGEFTIIKINN